VDGSTLPAATAQSVADSAACAKESTVRLCERTHISASTDIEGNCGEAAESIPWANRDEVALARQNLTQRN